MPPSPQRPPPDSAIHPPPYPPPPQTVSIVFFTDTWRPDSFYDKIAANRRLGLHTLCLLDIKVVRAQGGDGHGHLVQGVTHSPSSGFCTP